MRHSRIGLLVMACALICTVHVVSADTATESARVDRSPVDLAIARHGKWLVTANETSNSVSLVNTRDGKVEAVFEGEKEKIEDMINWCYQGSPMSLVAGVSVEWEGFVGEFEEFSVRYFY